MTLAPADPWAAAAEYLDPSAAVYDNDSAGWVREVLGEYVTDQQAAIHQSVREHRYTAVPSCHDVGKSYTASRISAHFIEVKPSGEAFLVTTAPTDKQVKAILWREIAKAWRKGKLKGRITLDAQWKLSHTDGPDEMVGYGRKPADNDPAAFQGIHARYMLIVIDEAGGVPKALFDAVDALATNENARVLAIGNPDDPASHFATVCKPGSGWNVVQLDALRSPNFTKEALRPYPEIRALMIAEGIKPSTEPIPDEVRPLLVSPAWVAERITRWGVGTPLWDSKVRGQFPKVSEDTLIEPGWIVRAQNAELEPDPFDSVLGVDVARFGKDKTIVMLREGGVVRCVHESPKSATTTTAGVVQELSRAHAFHPRAQVDDVGIGGGVTDILLEDGMETIPLIGSAACTERLPNGKPKFVNARSEWYWQVRELFMVGLLDIDPDDEDLAAQLTAIKYSLNRHGQIVVESKEDMRKRGMPSPDRADALVYACVHAGLLHNGTQSFADAMASHTSGASLTSDLLDAPW